MAQQLPNLIRHKKRLLSPVSFMEMKAKFPFTRTSWSDLGFYEFLWIGILLQKVGFHDAIDFARAYGTILGQISKFDKNMGPAWSYSKNVPKREFACSHNSRIDSLLNQAQQAIRTQTLIDKYPNISNEDILSIPKLGFIRKICNKHDPFALEVMFIQFSIALNSGKMHVPSQILSQLDPFSLKNYPDTSSSRVTAGMLRSNINATAAAEGHLKLSPAVPLPLWKFLADNSNCSA